MDSWVTAALVLMGFVLPGIAQTIFLKSEASERFASPIDGGRRLRGRRIFGENKTWRGFVVMIPATTLSFALLGGLASWIVPELLLWELGLWGWAGLGFAAVLGYTLGELPNSLIKRQLDIEPGQPPEHPLGRKLAFVADQLDSIIGGMLVIGLLLPTTLTFWGACLLLGATIHWLFNVLLRAIGVKERAA